MNKPFTRSQKSSLEQNETKDEDNEAKAPPSFFSSEQRETGKGKKSENKKERGHLFLPQHQIQQEALGEAQASY